MSMMGGAEIFIRSNGGFDDMPPQNSIILESQNIADAKFAGHVINDDEAFASNAIGGMLAYTVPSVLDVFSSTGTKKYTYYDFDDSTLPSANPHAAPAPYGLVFELSVKVPSAVEEILICKTKWSNCRIRYDEVYTPMYIDTVPSQVAFGMTVNMMMNPNRVHSSGDLPKVTYDPFYYLKIGNTLTDWEGLIDSSTRLGDWVTGSVSTRVG